MKIVVAVYLHPRSVTIVRRWLKIALICFVIFSILYAATYVCFFVPAPDHWHRAIGGYEYTNDTKDILRLHPGETDRELLAGIEYEADKVWTSASIRDIIFLSTAFWAALLLSYLLVLFTFESIAMKAEKPKSSGGMPPANTGKSPSHDEPTNTSSPEDDLPQLPPE